jgi:hypothetical protein
MMMITTNSIVAKPSRYNDMKRRLPKFTINDILLNSRDSSGRIATRLRAERSEFWGSIPGGVWKFFSSPQCPERLWGPRSLLSKGIRGSFPESKAAGAWSWPLTPIYFRGQRMSGAIHPLSQYAFMAWCSVKAQGQLYLYIY